MSQKVDGIIGSLSELESDIDSVNLSLAEMKKSLNSIAQREIDSLLEQTKKMANSEAESMISEAKSKAESESQKITQDVLSLSCLGVCHWPFNRPLGPGPSARMPLKPREVGRRSPRGANTLILGIYLSSIAWALEDPLVLFRRIRGAEF